MPNQTTNRKLTWLNDAQASSFPEDGGVYIVVKEQKVLYVGQTKNLRRRWKTHHKKEDFDRFSPVTIAYRFIDDKQKRLKIETRIIRKLRPVLCASDTRITIDQLNAIQEYYDKGYDPMFIQRLAGITSAELEDIVYITKSDNICRTKDS